MMSSCSPSSTIVSVAIALTALVAALCSQPLGAPALVLAALAVAGVALLWGLYSALSLRRAIVGMRAVCAGIAKGDFEQRVLGICDRGEIGDLQYALNDMIDRCDAFVREGSAAMDAVRHNKYFRRIRPEGLHGSLLIAAQVINDATAAMHARLMLLNRQTTEFEDAIRVILEALSGASSTLANVGNGLETGATETRHRATTVAAATEQATASMQTIAAATTELTASGGQVRHEVDRSAELAKQAVTIMEGAGQRIQGLNSAAERIGQVVELINAIAAQTNLLALNATIEAARAGEAGRGFSIVAQEVKTLAAETGRATSEISGNILEVQSATKDAVEIIGSVGKIIGEVDQVATQAAHGVTAQIEATNEIANNLEQASLGIHEISDNTHGLSDNAIQTEGLAGSTKTASDGLSQQTNRLTEAVRDFVVALRRGPLDGIGQSAAQTAARGQFQARPAKAA
jgi:methyl-accepting chemotaxis protein